MRLLRGGKLQRRSQPWKLELVRSLEDNDRTGVPTDTSGNIHTFAVDDGSAEMQRGVCQAGRRTCDFLISGSWKTYIFEKHTECSTMYSVITGRNLLGTCISTCISSWACGRIRYARPKSLGTILSFPVRPNYYSWWVGDPQTRELGTAAELRFPCSHCAVVVRWLCCQNPAARQFGKDLSAWQTDLL